MPEHSQLAVELLGKDYQVQNFEQGDDFYQALNEGLLENYGTDLKHFSMMIDVLMPLISVDDSRRKAGGVKGFCKRNNKAKLWLSVIEIEEKK